MAKFKELRLGQLCAIVGLVIVLILLVVGKLIFFPLGLLFLLAFAAVIL